MARPEFVEQARGRRTFKTEAMKGTKGGAQGIECPAGRIKQRRCEDRRTVLRNGERGSQGHVIEGFIGVSVVHAFNRMATLQCTIIFMSE